MMTIDTNNARLVFASKDLPRVILEDPSAFYAAFSEGEDALTAYLTALWEARQAMADSPFFPVLSPFVLEDGEEGFCALLLITLYATASAKKIMSAIVFGSAMDPRVFAALPERLPGGKTLLLREYRMEKGGDLYERVIGTLYQGCDNDLQLFDPPTPQVIDREKPLADERQEAAAVDRIVRFCLEND